MGLVPRQHLAAAAEQAKAIVHMIAYRVECKKFHARGRELDGQRNAVKLPADIGDRGDRARVGRELRDRNARAFDEQSYGLRGRQGLRIDVVVARRDGQCRQRKFTLAGNK